MVDASEPPVLFGHNEAPNPAEFLLHALAGCLTLTIVNVAAARKVDADRGQLDARGRPRRPRRDRARRLLPQRVRAHPRLLLDQGRRRRARSCEEIVERAQGALGRLRHGLQPASPVDVRAEVG